jgi:soluble lytic murein transglycosylase-like protein
MVLGNLMRKLVVGGALVVLSLATSAARADEAEIRALIAQYAAANGVPETLVHRIVRRESNYNPRASGRGGALGLMQIKHATARGMGYTGPASGLLDASTNLAYGVPYLAGAYRVAGGNADRAVAYYASGYYYAAKRLGLANAARQPATAIIAAAAAPTEATGSVTADAGPQPGWDRLADMR